MRFHNYAYYNVYIVHCVPSCSLGPLVKKIKDSQIEVIINALCSNMFSDSERLRDISSVGLKTVIAELPRTTPAVATNASRNITSRMVEAIAKPVSLCVCVCVCCCVLLWGRGEDPILIIELGFAGLESVRTLGDTGHFGRSDPSLWR